jgi:murein DD-endopeptidase MepM/ murein hydrolase activator NlpD
VTVDRDSTRWEGETVPQRSYPLARPARIIGRPFQGTHTIKNRDGTFQWQSCRAFDLSTPVGTPVLAIWDGVIGQRFGPLSSTDPRFEGLRCYVEVPRGNQFYYAHLTGFAAGIAPGARVTSGQVIGFSGKANGAPHLHVACMLGDPEAKLLSGKLPPGAPKAAGWGARADVPEDWECENAVPPGEGEAVPEEAPETES